MLEDCRLPVAVRRGRRLTLAIVLIALSFLPISVHAQSSGDRPDSTIRNAQLTLRNTTKDTLRVELRLGAATDCAANPLATLQLVPPGRDWLIATKRVICWRRQSVARTASQQWTAWHRVVLGQRERAKDIL